MDDGDYDLLGTNERCIRSQDQVARNEAITTVIAIDCLYWKVVQFYHILRGRVMEVE